MPDLAAIRDGLPSSGASFTGRPFTLLPRSVHALALAVLRERRAELAWFALAFIILKVTQLTAVLNWNLLHGPVLTHSELLTGPALLGMWGGIKVQDAIPQRAFNRAVLGFLAVSGLGLL